MAKSEVRVMVEYIIEMPSDIMLTKVDDFIKNEIDEGADSENIKGRTITDVAFAEQPGIVDQYHIVKGALDMVQGVIETNKDNAGEAMESIKVLVDQAIEEVGDDEDED